MKCTDYIPGKENAKQPRLFPAFCGFNPDVGFKASLVDEDEITRVINNSDTRSALKMKNGPDQVDAAVDLYYPNIKFLAQHRAVDVIVTVNHAPVLV